MTVLWCWGLWEVSVLEHGLNTFLVCNLWAVPKECLELDLLISRVVLWVALAWWASGHVAPVAVWVIPAGRSSRVPVCRGIPRMAVVAVCGMGCMPPVVTGAFVMLGLMAWSLPVKAVPLALSVMEGVWPVPAAVVMMQVEVRSTMMEGWPWWGNFLRAVLGKMTKIISVVTLYMRVVATNITFLSTNKTVVTVGHHVYCGRW